MQELTLYDNRKIHSRHFFLVVILQAEIRFNLNTKRVILTILFRRYLDGREWIQLASEDVSSNRRRWVTALKSIGLKIFVCQNMSTCMRFFTPILPKGIPPHSSGIQRRLL